MLLFTLAVAVLVGCGSSGVKDSGSGGDDGLFADAGHDAGVDAGGGCVCASAGACCDGCNAKNESERCEPGGAGSWGVCSKGSCESVGAVRTFEGHGSNARVQAAAFSPGGELLVTAASRDFTGGGTDGETIVWDVKTGAMVKSFSGAAVGAAFSPDGKLLAAGGTPVSIYRTSDWGLETTLSDTHGPVAFSRNGARLAAGGAGGMGIFDTSGWSKLAAMPNDPDPKTVLFAFAFSADGTLLISGTSQNGMGSPHGDIAVWNAATGERANTLACTCMAAVFSPDGASLGTTCWYFLYLWDFTTASIATKYMTQDINISLAWSPDGKWLASGTYLGPLNVFEAATLSQSSIPVKRLPVVGVKGLAFSPDGKLIAAGGLSDAKVYVWEHGIKE
jgi:WD40 repeat protein